MVAIGKNKSPDSENGNDINVNSLYQFEIHKYKGIWLFLVQS